MSARRQNCCPTAPSWGTKLFLRFLADSRQLQHLSLAPFNLHKARRVRRERLPSDDFFERAPQSSVPPHSAPQGRASEKHARHSGETSVFGREPYLVRPESDSSSNR
jgi:hypothetical protein